MTELSCLREKTSPHNAEIEYPKRRKTETLPSIITNSNLYSVELENVHKQAFYQRNLVADLLIVKGQAKYDSREMENAMSYLEKALCVLMFVILGNQDLRKTRCDNQYLLREFTPSDASEKEIFLNQKLRIYQKLVYCYLDSGRFHDAAYVCNESLKINPNQNQLIFFRYLLNFINGNENKENVFSINNSLVSIYSSLDDYAKEFVTSRFHKDLNLLKIFESKQTNLNETTSHLPTTISSCKFSDYNENSIQDHKFLMKLPFWVFLFALILIFTTYLF